jgi:hypothetical protein
MEYRYLQLEFVDDMVSGLKTVLSIHAKYFIRPYLSRRVYVPGFCYNQAGFLLLSRIINRLELKLCFIHRCKKVLPSLKMHDF